MRRRGYRRLLTLSLGIIVALLGPGCGGSGDGSGGDSGSPSHAFAAESYPVLLLDKQWQPTAFYVGRLSVGCGTADYRAELRSSSEQLPLHVSYQRCSLGSKQARIESGGCDYVLLAGPQGKPVPVRIACRGGRSIRIVFPGSCTVEIEPQTPEGGVQFGSEGRGSDRFPVVTFGMTGISATGSGSPGCPVAAGDKFEVNFRIDLPAFESLPDGKGKRVGVRIT